jgi:heat-inducible transcriptional repressor
MADLEGMGLLYARTPVPDVVPTEKGLRLFVDGMLQVGDLTSEENARLSRIG